MIIKIKLDIFLFLFLLSNIVSTAVSLYPVLSSLSLVVNLITILYGSLYLLYQMPPIQKRGFLFYIYAIWITVMIVTGFSFELRIIGRLFSNPEFAFFLLFPLIIYAPFTPKFFNTLVRFLVIFNVFFLVFILLSYNKILLDYNLYELISKRFAYGNAFLILIYGFLSPKRKMLSVLIAIILIIIALILGRRAQLFYLGLTTLSGWLLYIFYFKKKYLFINVMAAALLIISGVVFNVDRAFESNFTRLVNKIDDDTRSGTEEDFYAEMSTYDWIAGKGINGKYKTSMVIDFDYEGDTRSMEDKNFRYGIETGYLNTILKGGIIKLGLDLIIILYAIWMGMFFGRNLLVKAAVVFLLVYLATLYPENANAFNLRYLLVWISVGICVNKTLRSLTNMEFSKQYLKNGK